MTRSRTTISLSLGLALLLACAAVSPILAADTRAYELRTYTAEEGKLDDLHRRFREHTIGLFEKHGMTVVGFWTPIAEPESKNTLVYVLSYPSVEARAKSWQAFRDDPEWKRVAEESQKNGPLVAKVDSKMMAATDYSPLE